MLGTYQERMDALKELYPTWTPRTFWTQFVFTQERFPHQPFLIYNNQIYDYEQVRSRADKLARSLISTGVRPKEHVALLMRNCPEAIELSLAMAKIGAIRIPVHAKSGPEELKRVLLLSNSTVLITERSLPEEVLDALPELRIVILLEAEAESSGIVVSWNDFCSDSAKVSQAFCEKLSKSQQDPASTASIMFTSGSTSMPKGVLVTHDMLLRSAFGTVRRRCMEIGRRIYMPIPLYHTMAYVEALTTSILVGGSLIMTNEKFDPEEAVSMMIRHSANDIVCVPIIMMDIISLKGISDLPFPALHAAYWAGDCPSWIWEKARDVLGVEDITTAYGMTECGSTTAIFSPMDDPDRLGKWHGRIKPGVDMNLPERETKQLSVRICDPETGEGLPRNTIGELRCSGPTVTKGYYNNAEATVAAFDEDGWFRTGDICVMDEEGFLKFIGRISDMYKINGENVSPQFVDDVISRCALVKAVGTVGVRHERYGEVGVAFVETYAPFDTVAKQLECYCLENLAGYQVPRYIFPVEHDDWPLTASGKLKKSRLREMAYELLREQKEKLF